MLGLTNQWSRKANPLRDGKPDLISANFNTNTLSVLTNNGSGGFELMGSYTVGNNPIAVTAADVNGDNKVDLISANHGWPPVYGNTLSVLTNDGSGHFTFAASLVVGQIPWSVAAADVNADGKMDLISANEGEGTLSVMTNDGCGSFTLSGKYSVASFTTSVTTADVNGDSMPDMICAVFSPIKPYVFLTGLTVFTNNGSGGFVLAANLGAGSNPYAVTTADINSDGKVDLISDNPVIQNAKVSVFTNNGYGGFQLAPNYSLENKFAPVVADINGDGWVDLVCCNATNNIFIYTNNMNGGFALASTLVLGSNPTWFVTSDVSGDGRLDLISQNNDSTLSVFTNVLTFLPQLALKRSNNNVIVSWPSSWTGWAGWNLEASTSLNSPNWTTFSGMIGDNGTTQTATNSTSPGNLFFRLAHP